MWTVFPLPIRDAGKFGPAAVADRVCAIAFLAPARSTLIEKAGVFDSHIDRGAVHVRRKIAARKGPAA